MVLHTVAHAPRAHTHATRGLCQISHLGIFAMVWQNVAEAHATRPLGHAPRESQAQ